jgi:hypothetical protein
MTPSQQDLDTATRWLNKLKTGGWKLDERMVDIWANALKDEREKIKTEIQKLFDDTPLSYGFDADRKSQDFRYGVEQGVNDVCRHNSRILEKVKEL